MSRPSRHQMLMAIARAAATRATCYRLNVGAVLTFNGNVLSIGYNGAPSGRPHCGGNVCPYFTQAGCQVVHAERNALERAGWYKASKVQHLYVTHSPCLACADLVVGWADGVVSDVYFETPYRDPTPIQRLIAGDVRVWQVLPSGLLVEQSTGRLVAE